MKVVSQSLVRRVVGPSSGSSYITHGMELRAFIVRKMAKSIHNMWSYKGKELHLLPQNDILAKNLIYIHS